jgi:pimeloyl-ACP methyl ester carboxylesterase
MMLTSRTFLLLMVTFASGLSGQSPPYDMPLPTEPPYYRVRYEASTAEGELAFPVTYTLWIPPTAKALRGVVVHQHGCGEGSCKSGQTGAFDLHWQALAAKHNCALMSPTYEQPEKANCQLWCDPRNGSAVTFQKSLVDLGTQSNHPELATVPWALWGHSGGGHWSGGMVLLHPERVAAAWLRSGVPPVKSVEGKPAAYSVSDAACQVPVMCNLGTQEGVTVKDGRFAGVWGGTLTFFRTVREQGGLVGIAVDPLTSHECGNQRYLAIPWLDACLAARLPAKPGTALRPMPKDEAWLAPLLENDVKGAVPVAATEFKEKIAESIWLPNTAMAQAWQQYVNDTAVPDTTPPPAPTDLQVVGKELSWQAAADVESGLASFIIERDGKVLANVPQQSKNPFGRPLFQNLQYSDTPARPLAEMRYTDTTAEAGKTYQYRVIAVNTVGLKSQ